MQIIDDGDRNEDEEKLKRQRQLAAEKEAERQEKEEKKFKEKSLLAYQHRLNTAVYAEEAQKMKEDKIREHEINLFSKDVTKQILQNQVRKSNTINIPNVML